MTTEDEIQKAHGEWYGRVKGLHWNHRDPVAAFTAGYRAAQAARATYLDRLLSRIERPEAEQLFEKMLDMCLETWAIVDVHPDDKAKAVELLRAYVGQFAQAAPEPPR